MCICKCGFKTFACGMVAGFTCGAICVGLSKKMQNIVKKGKKMVQEKLADQNDEQNTEA